MSQKTREKYGIRLPVMVDVGRGTGLTAAARSEFACEVEAAAPVAPVWNNISRLWFVQTGAGMVPCDPQPAPPVEILRGDMTDAEMRARGRALASLPPSVKVSA
jgi:hypothetical protein